MPYTTDENGRGPAWSNSLFEDNAEFGYGMLLAAAHMQDKIAQTMKDMLQRDIPEQLKEAVDEWIEARNDGEASKTKSAQLLKVIDGMGAVDDVLLKKDIDNILARKDYLVKKSIWAVGGDGWAYDIGYGGLDHVLASGENINILVFDTEVYSNTGGQASKATPAAAIAKFSAAGKRIQKKDLGMMAMSYGYVYVAQTSMGADKEQLIKAFREAESYDGPSLIICYAPCINHGLKEGMGHSQRNAADAVESGYWHLYRYNPLLKEAGKNPFTLDSKKPTKSFRQYIMNQVRYSSLAKEFPDVSDKLFAMAEENAIERYEKYARMAAEPDAIPEPVKKEA